MELPLSTEIASARSAISALVELRDSGPPLRGGAPTPQRPRPETAWRALEERIAAQVAALEQRQQAEHVDGGSRAAGAAVARLEARVRALEGQGARTDRRAAELAGLSQALAEEQRALLPRIDRLEERLRSSRPRDALQAQTSGLADELGRRLVTVEREQRAAGQNLRHLLGLSEELQQRQQRQRAFEEGLEGRLRALEEGFRVAASDGDRRLEGAASASFLPPPSLRSLPPHLPVDQLEVLEARIQALSDIVEELRSRPAEIQVDAINSPGKVTNEMGQARPAEGLLRLAEHEAHIAELHMRLQLVPTHEQVEAAAQGAERRARAAAREATEDLAAQTASLAHSCQEARTRLERLSTELADRTSRVEEHEVRLNLMLTRLGLTEQKVQGCLDRLERLPGAAQLRSLCREELQRQLQEVNLEGLARSVEMQAQALEELGSQMRLQVHSEVQQWLREESQGDFSLRLVESPGDWLRGEPPETREHEAMEVLGTDRARRLPPAPPLPAASPAVSPALPVSPVLSLSQRQNASVSATSVGAEGVEVAHGEAGRQGPAELPPG